MPPAASDALSRIAAFADVPTPALIVDLAKARANHARALGMLDPARARLRPHFKAHKCTTLALLQMGDGVSGVCCQTTWEAAALVKAIEAQGGKNVKTAHFATDHSYSDHRIALESAVMRWLASLK